MEKVRIEISEDLLKATLEVLPPSPGSKPLTRGDLVQAIRAAGVSHGLNTECLGEIVEACARDGAPPPPFVIAEGRKPRPGRDGSLELEPAFATADEAPDELDDRERIDHRERGGVRSVQAGERIGVLRPGVPGDPGRGVDGSVLDADPVAGPKLGAGRHVELNEREDGAVELVAAMDGMVHVDDRGRLSVRDEIVIRGDVDYGTGNIEARGTVVVRGTVRTAFKLTATRDVRVDESIEDAVVEVGGNLTVEMSILGGDEGHVRVGEKLVVHNAQNARVRCEGDIEITGSATGSDIECLGRLTAVAGRGRLSGGEYTAASGLEANELGSTIGAPTLVRVGMDAAGGAELSVIETEREETAEQAKLLRQQLADARETATEGDVTQTRARRVRELMKEMRELTDANARLEQRRRAILKRAEAWPSPEIRVHGIVHSGVVLQLRDLTHRITTHLEGVRVHHNRESNRLEVEPL